MLCELFWQDESEDEREPTIEEEDEIEEDLVPAVDSVCLDRGKPFQLLAPTDTIVLEFAPPAERKGRGRDDERNAIHCSL